MLTLLDDLRFSAQMLFKGGVTSALELFGTMARLLCSVAAIATLLPARRAASIDPRVAFTAR